MAVKYVVTSAVVMCSDGKETTKLIGNTNSEIGCKIRILEPENTPENFESNFGICLILTAKNNGIPTPCNLGDIVPDWIDTNDCLVSSDSYPTVTMDSFSVCWNGGFIVPLTDGQEMEDFDFTDWLIGNARVGHAFAFLGLLLDSSIARQTQIAEQRAAETLSRIGRNSGVPSRNRKIKEAARIIATTRANLVVERGLSRSLPGVGLVVDLIERTNAARQRGESTNEIVTGFVADLTVSGAITVASAKFGPILGTVVGEILHVNSESARESLRDRLRNPIPEGMTIEEYMEFNPSS